MIIMQIVMIIMTKTHNIQHTTHKKAKTQKGVKPIMMIIAIWIIIIRNQTAYNNHPKSALSNCGKAALDEATEPWGIKVERVEM